MSLSSELRVWPGRAWISAAVLLAVAACLSGSCASSPVAANVGSGLPPDLLPPLIDRALFFEEPEISDGQISPDGKFISFLRRSEQGAQLWIKSREKSLTTAEAVPGAGQGVVADYVWTRDSQRILFRQAEGRDGGAHLWVVDWAGPHLAAGPAARDLTPFGNVDVQLLAAPETTPGWVVVAINDRDPKARDVYRVEIATGKRQLVFKNEADVTEWTTDVTGKLRLGRRPTKDGGQEMLRVDGSRLTQVLTCGPLEVCVPVRVHKDGRRIYLITNKGRPDLSRLVLLDLTRMSFDIADSDPDEAVDFGAADFSALTGELAATIYQGDRLRTYPHDKAYRRAFEALHAAVPDGDVRLTSSSVDERFRLATVDSDLDPGATYLYDDATGRVDLVYRSRPRLPIEHLSAMRSVKYEARDGNTIHAYLTVPRGSSFRDMPAVVLPHGGPWSRDVWGYNAVAQFLANRGYLVLQPNFRGSTGFGRRFSDLGNKQWGTGGMQNDLTDGALWLAEQRFADPKRIAIMGVSYGGFATLAGLAFDSKIWAAGVEMMGPGSILTWLRSASRQGGPARAVCDLRVGDPSDPKQLATLEAQSPLRALKSIVAPLLVVQEGGESDGNRAETDQVVRSVRDAGRPVEYLVTPATRVGPSGLEDRLAVFAAVEGFLRRHLGGRAQDSVPGPIAQRLTAISIDVRTLANGTQGSGGARAQ
jgi:dipeptidyl aminopeptidase/acylaminoacyl peptidase